MDIFKHDRFAIAGYAHAQGQTVAREDWPTSEIELDFFNAGIRQSQTANGTAANALLCVDTTNRSGCDPGISLHPANWR